MFQFLRDAGCWMRNPPRHVHNPSSTRFATGRENPSCVNEGKSRLRIMPVEVQVTLPVAYRYQ